MARRQTLTGLGIGLAAAGVTTAVGLATDRLLRARQTALALDTTEDYAVTPDKELVAIASDGLPLHVEIDEPKGAPPDLPPGAVAPTVVFSHGYCLALQSWVYQRRALSAAGYRVVLWDQRGHGRSGTGDAESYTIDQLGEDLDAVIATAAPEGPLVLVGHSMGGMTQMALAVNHAALVRERVVGAAFVATSPGSLNTVSWGLGRMLGTMARRLGPVAMGRLATRQDLVDSALGGTTEVQNFFVNRYSFASPVPMSAVDLTRQMIFATRLEVMHGFVPSFESHDKREAIAQYEGIETLVINGMEDLLTPPDHSEEIVRLLPGAEHVLVADAGHVIMLEHPEVVSEQLLLLVGRAARATAQEKGRARERTSVRRTLTDVAQRRRVGALKDKPAKDKPATDKPAKDTSAEAGPAAPSRGSGKPSRRRRSRSAGDSEGDAGRAS